MAEEFQKEMVLDELTRATDVGEQRSRAQLQALGIGAGDLDAVLRELHQGGLISQVAPDEWEAAEPVEREVAVPDVPDVPDVPGPPARLRPAGLPSRGRAATAVTSAQVSMPRAVADVLEAGALGELLKAGIETTDPGETFVFEVTP